MPESVDRPCLAKVAFIYLAKNDQRPLEIAYVTPAAAKRVRLFGTNQHQDVEPDHAFVIIGRRIETNERNERRQGYIAVAPVSQWNFNAVICDPWAKRCYFADRLPVEMEMLNRVSAGRTALSSEVRLEVGEQWTA